MNEVNNALDYQIFEFLEADKIENSQKLQMKDSRNIEPKLSPVSGYD